MDAWTTNSVQTADRVSAFLWKVYGWMAIGLGLTAMVAFAVAGSPDLLRVLVGNRLVFFGLVIAELGLVFYLSARADRLAPGTAAGLFALYSALNGVPLSAILLVYTGESVTMTFVVMGFGTVFNAVVNRRDPTSGWATRSSASRPSRRRTKAPRLSSSLVPRGMTRSRAIRSLPRQEKSPDLTNGPSLVGARSWKPSGSGWSRPRTTAQARSPGGSRRARRRATGSTRRCGCGG